MTDTPGTVGSVSVAVQADLGPLESGLQAAQRRAQSFDGAVGASMQNVSRAVQAAAGSVAGVSKAFSSAQAAGAATWTSFLKENLAAYRQLEGSGAAAMKRLSVEWAEYKAAVAGGRAELAKFMSAQQVSAGPSPQQLLGIAPSSGYAAAAAGVQAFGDDLDKLRQKYDPLYVAQARYQQSLADIRTLVATGVMSQDAATAALTRNLQQRNVAVAAIQAEAVATTAGTTAATGLAAAGVAAAHGHQMLSTQAMAAAHSVRGFAEMMAMGVPVYQALGMEANNLTYAMSHPGGLTGAMREGLSAFSGLINPMTLVVGGLAAVGFAVYAAGARWTDLQKTVSASLRGIGEASGASVGSINQLAESLGAVSGLSVAEATRAAAAFASVGTIGAQSFGDLIKMTKEYAEITGKATDEAAGMLAKMFADPGRGAKQLADQLGVLDYSTIKYIGSLQAQGQQQAAINALMQAVSPILDVTAARVREQASFWSKLGNAISDAFLKLGRIVSGDLAGKTTEQLQAMRRSLQDEIDRLQKMGVPSGVGSPFDLLTRQLLSVNDALNKLSEQSDRAREKLQNIESRRVGELVDALVPSVDASQKLDDQVAALARAMVDPSFEEFRKKIGDALPLAFERAKEAAASFMSDTDKMMLQSEVGRASVDALSPAQKSRIAYYNKMIELSGEAGKALTEEQKRTLAANAAYEASGGIQTAIQLRIREISVLGELATVEQKAAATRKQLDLERAQGVSITGQQVDALVNLTRVQAEYDLLNRKAAAGVFDLGTAAKAAGDQLRAWVDQGLLDPKNAREMANAQEILAARTRDLKQAALDANPVLKAQRDAEFELAQAFRSTAEAAAAASARQLYGDDYLQHLNDAVPRTVALTQRLKDARDLATDFGTTLAQGLAQGGKLTDSLNSALQSVANTLIQMAVKNLVNQAFGSLLGGSGGTLSISGGGGGGLLGGLFSGLGSIFSGGLLGGSIIPGILHAGGPVASAPSSGRSFPSEIFVSAPRFHSGKAAFGPNEMPAILDRREEVGYPSQLAKKYGGGGDAYITQNIIVDGATGNTEVRQMVAAGVAQANAQAATALAAFSKNGLPKRIQELRTRGA